MCTTKAVAVRDTVSDIEIDFVLMWISTPPVVDHTILLSFANVCSFVSCCKAMNQLHIDVESKLELLEDSLPLNYCIVSCALGLLRLNSKLWLLCL